MTNGSSLIDYIKRLIGTFFQIFLGILFNIKYNIIKAEINISNSKSNCGIKYVSEFKYPVIIDNNKDNNNILSNNDDNYLYKHISNSNAKLMINEQNKCSNNYLNNNLKFKETKEILLDKLNKYDEKEEACLESPFQRGSNYFYLKKIKSRNDKQLDRYILYYSEDLKNDGIPILDTRDILIDKSNMKEVEIDQLNDVPNVILRGCWVSDNGSYCAYGYTTTFSPTILTVKIRNVLTGKDNELDTLVIENVNSNADLDNNNTINNINTLHLNDNSIISDAFNISLVWYGGERGFFYTLTSIQDINNELFQHQQILFHTYNSKQSDDYLVYSNEQSNIVLNLLLTPDCRYLLIEAYQIEYAAETQRLELSSIYGDITASKGNKVYYIDLTNFSKYDSTIETKNILYLLCVELIDNFNYRFQFITNIYEELWFRTNHNASNYHVVKISLPDVNLTLPDEDKYTEIRDDENDHDNDDLYFSFSKNKNKIDIEKNIKDNETIDKMCGSDIEINRLVSDISENDNDDDIDIIIFKSLKCLHITLGFSFVLENTIVWIPADNKKILQYAGIAGHTVLVLKYLQLGGSSNDVYLYDFANTLEDSEHQPLDISDSVAFVSLPHPANGTISTPSCSFFSSDIFYKCTGFSDSGSIFRAILKRESFKGSISMSFDQFYISTLPYEIDSYDYETKQIFSISTSGIKIPITLFGNRNILEDLKNGQRTPAPCILYVNGGHGISILPEFSLPVLLFASNYNGLFAIVNTRGSGIYGSDWHKDGSGSNINNAINDVITVSEFLISNDYTNSDNLALLGENHGGVLIGSAVNKRPDLFKCSAVNSGLFDVLNCIKMTPPRRIINQNDDDISHDYNENDRSNSDDSSNSFSSAHSIEINVASTKSDSSKKKGIDCSWKQEYIGENSSTISINNISPLQLVSNEVKDYNYPSILLTGSINDYPICFNHSLLYISQLQQIIGVKNNQLNPLLLLSSEKIDGDIKKDNNIQADIFAFIISQIVKE